MYFHKSVVEVEDITPVQRSVGMVVFKITMLSRKDASQISALTLL